MRIENVRAIPIAYPEPNDDGRIRHLCLVRVTTDSGLVGWGEAVTMFEEASIATAAIIDGMAEAVLIGADPRDVTHLWASMKGHAWWYGEGGIASLAIAALDIALWDLKGKAANLPVLALLGGAVHERLPAMATGHAVHAEISDLVEEIAGWVGDGLHAVKVGFGKKGLAHLGFDHDRDIEFVAKLRASIGEGKGIMIDIGNAIRWDVAKAVRRTNAMEKYNIAWIEEPLGRDNLAGYATLKAKTRTRIAFGEREWDVKGITRIVASGTVDVVGIDPGRAEGITGFFRACQIIEAASLQANAHSYSSAIVAAASLAVSMASASTRVLEVKPLPNPMQDELVSTPVTHTHGWFYPPTEPGLGIAVNEDVVERYSLRQAG